MKSRTNGVRPLQAAHVEAIALEAPHVEQIALEAPHVECARLEGAEPVKVAKPRKAKAKAKRKPRVTAPGKKSGDKAPVSDQEKPETP